VGRRLWSVLDRFAVGFGPKQLRKASERFETSFVVEKINMAPKPREQAANLPLETYVRVSDI
jgi:hypothetical protein